MYTASPSQGERYYLCLLLHHIPGTTSSTDLKISHRGTIHSTYKETAIALGLLESDKEWNECVEEAVVSLMPVQLHSLFVTILIFREPAEPVVLWETYKEVMDEDGQVAMSKEEP